MKNITKNILYLSFNFPPNCTVASLQNVYMASYLKKIGWNLNVLTIHEDDIERNIGPPDNSLLEIVGLLDIYRIRYKCILNTVSQWKNNIIRFVCHDRSSNTICVHENKDNYINEIGFLRSLFDNIKNIIYCELLSFPDRHFSWIFSGFSGARKILKEKNIDLIYASGPPQSTYVLGFILKKIFKIPLVLDIQDPWIGNPYNRDNSRVYCYFSRILQKLVFENADRIRVTSSFLKDHLIKFNTILERKIFIGGSGFSEYIKQSNVENIYKRPDKFIITHAGTLYKKRNPKIFIRAILHMIDGGILTQDDLLLRFYGHNETLDPELVRLLKDPHLGRCLEVGLLSHSECINKMLESNMLLVFQQGTKMQIPAKLFEYLSIGKPILAIADEESATSEIILREEFGTCIPDDERKIINEITKAYNNRKESIVQRYYPNSYKYCYKSLSNELSCKFLEILDNK